MVERANTLSNASHLSRHASEVNAYAASRSNSAISNMLADNSTRFGLDARSLAADLSGINHADRGMMLNALSDRLTPTQMGEVMRALDQQRGKNTPGPDDEGADKVIGKADEASPSATKIIGDMISAALAEAKTRAADTLHIGAILGPDTAALAARSPSLTADMRALAADGWTIVTGTAGDGSFCDKSAKTITVDPNELGNPAALVQTLAHEVGHARYTATVDVSSREAFVRTQLADEGAATLSNIRVQREIIANGGVDIGIAGQTANHAAYEAAYETYLITGDAAAAHDAIGAIFGNGETTSTTGQSYNDYYGSWYDANYP